MSSTERVITIEAGMAVRGTLRSQLERLKFLGHPVSWHENKGWLDSNFAVKGPPAVLLAISEWIDRINQE